MLEVCNQDLDLGRCAALALWSLAKSSKNKEAIRETGAIPLLSKLMVSNQVDVVIPVVGILQECASEPTFREAIRTQGLLSQFVAGLSSDSAELVQFCAKAIYMVRAGYAIKVHLSNDFTSNPILLTLLYFCFKCAEDEESREIVYRLGAVDPLLLIIQNFELRKNKVNPSA